MKVLVTGGAGFIGSALTKHLLKKKHEVTILDDFTSGTAHAIRECFNYGKRFFCVKGSVLDKPLVDSLVRDSDIIFHLAAKVHVEESILDPAEAFNTNSVGTLNILEAARRWTPRYIVYASSTEVYGTSQSDLIKEDHRIHPQSPYAAGKAAADALCTCYVHSYDLPVITFRQFNTYGPGQRFKGYSAVIPIFAQRLHNGRPPIVFGNGKQSRDFHYIDDLLNGYDLVIKDPKKVIGKIINFGTGVPTTVNTLAEEMIKAAADVWKRKELLKLKPAHAPKRPGEVMRFAADSMRAKKLLGFKPKITLKQGLRKYLLWFSKEYE